MSDGNSIHRLMTISSGAIGEFAPSGLIEDPDIAPDSGRLLMSLLQARNGFFAFESALLVRPSRAVGPVHGIIEWNRRDLWRNLYGSQLAGLTFFATDLFSVQYAYRGGEIVSVNPETGEIKLLAPTLDTWVELVISQYDDYSGWSVAHEWQLAHGPLPPGTRLAPKMPFVLGGDFCVENMRVLDELDAICRNGRLFGAIKDLPDGRIVTLHGWL